MTNESALLGLLADLQKQLYALREEATRLQQENAALLARMEGGE